MNQTFLALQATYSHVELAFFKNNQLMQTVRNNNTKASSHLVELIDAMLTENKIALANLDFFAVDKGPGAFTSLRVAIATINGIGFAKNSIFIGVDGLAALLYDASKESASPSLIIALLNAYGNEVYYAFKHTKDSVHEAATGCLNITDFLSLIETKNITDPVIFTGNGYPLHEALIRQRLSSHTLKYTGKSTPSAEAIGILGYEQIKNGASCESKITPHYMKSQLFAAQKN